MLKFEDLTTIEEDQFVPVINEYLPVVFPELISSLKLLVHSREVILVDLVSILAKEALNQGWDQVEVFF